MRGKRTLIPAVALLLLLAGCSSVAGSPPPVPIPTLPASTGAPTGTWVYPGKVEIGNLYPGAEAEHTISVYNGNDKESTFLVYYENLPRASGEYQLAPEEVSSWVEISEVAPVLASNETRDILVILKVPKDAKVTVDKFGFLIVVAEKDQVGDVHVRNAVKWLVDMR